MDVDIGIGKMFGVKCQTGASCSKCHFSPYPGNPATEQFQTAGHLTRPRGPRPAGDVQHHYQQRTLPGPGLMPKPFHGAPAARDYGAQEMFLRDLQRNPSRSLFYMFCVNISNAVTTF